MVPALTEDTAHCCAAVKNGDVSTVDDPIGWYQPITGTEDDYGLCGVVEVSLPSNRLVGKLDDSNVAAIQAASQEATSTGGSRGRLGLTALQLLDVSTPVDPENQEEIDNANKLTGAIPTWLLELPTLQAAELAGNNFTYNATALDELSKKEVESCQKVGGGAVAASEAAESASCTPVQATWRGVSRARCFSFSGAHVPTPGENACVDCVETTAHTYLYMVIVILALLGLVAAPAAYALYKASRRADAAYQGGGLKRRVAAATVVLFHASCSAIIVCISAEAEVAPAIPLSMRRVAACVTLDPLCVAFPLCFTDASLELAQNLGSHYIFTSVLAWVLCTPALAIGAAVYVRRKARREKNAARARRAADAELAPTAVVALLQAAVSRTIRQLLSPLGFRATYHIGVGAIVHGFIAGIVLLVLQIAVLARYARQLSFSVASRKQGAEEERTRGGYAVSLRFVSGLYRQKGHASFWTLGQWGIHLALLVSTYVLTADGTSAGSAVSVGLALLILVVSVGAIAHAYIEPYEYRFLNNVASRLWGCQLLFLCTIAAWGIVFNWSYDTTLVPLVETLLWFFFAGSPALGIFFLYRGLKASAPAARGYASRAMPLWLSGSAWGEIALPAGAVAVLSLHPRPPRADTVFDAIHGVVRAPKPKPPGLFARMAQKRAAAKAAAAAAKAADGDKGGGDGGKGGGEKKKGWGAMFGGRSKGKGRRGGRRRWRGLWVRRAARGAGRCRSAAGRRRRRRRWRGPPAAAAPEARASGRRRRSGAARRRRRR